MQWRHVTITITTADKSVGPFTLDPEADYADGLDSAIDNTVTAFQEAARNMRQDHEWTRLVVTITPNGPWTIPEDGDNV